MTGQASEDLVSIAARKGLIDEKTARASLGGAAPTAQRMVECGILREKDLSRVLQDYHGRLAEKVQQAMAKEPRPRAANTQST